MRESIVLLALCLGACATSQTSPAQSFAQACVSYTSALNSATALNNAGKLSKSAVIEISAIEARITPICLQPAPNNAADLTTQVTAAVTTLTVLAAAPKAPAK